MEEIKMDRIEDAIADFKEGKFVIVVDDEDRENEGVVKNWICRIRSVIILLYWVLLLR